MAEADQKDTPAGYERVTLDEFLRRKFAEVLDLELANRLVRQELENKTRHYSYLDGTGREHHDDLPKGFWPPAKFEGATAVREAYTLPPDPMFAELAKLQWQATRASMISPGHLPPPQPIQGRTIPALKIYRVMVLVEKTVSEQTTRPAESAIGDVPSAAEPEPEPADESIPEPHHAAVLVTDEAGELPETAAEPTKAETGAPDKTPVKKYESGVEWLEAVVRQERDALSAMKNVTAVAESLGQRSKTDPTCPQPLKQSYIKELLRPLRLFPLVNRGRKSSKHS